MNTLAEKAASNGSPEAKAYRFVPTEHELRLNIGAGPSEFPGWTPVDRKNGQEAYPLAYPEDSAKEIRASHVLEHFGYTETIAVLKDWYRVLQPGGRLRVAVPDEGRMAYMQAKGEPGDYTRWRYGGQTDANDFHKTGFDEAGLRQALQMAGFIAVDRWKPDYPDTSQMEISLNLEAFKPTVGALGAAKGRKIHAVMSMPRLAFADNMYAALKVFVPLGVEFTRFTGAYWGECLERCMVDVIEKDPALEWVVTVDYDSVFTLQQFQKMAMLFDTYPKYDALAPIQPKRGSDGTVLCKTTADVTVDYMWGDIAPMDTAHFGMTFFRVSALKKLPHPWFHSVPGKDGSWNEGNIDADIEFWNKWKRAGLTLGVTPRIGIGHIENLIAWVNEDFTIVHQPTGQYDIHGPPRIARA